MSLGDAKGALGRIRELLGPVLAGEEAWERLSHQVVSSEVAAGTRVRAVGEPVDDLLIVELGTFEVAAPGEPPCWATPGAFIGLGAALSEAASEVDVIALRHGRLARFPVRALWEDRVGGTRGALAAVARLARLPDAGLVTVPPDPLVIAALLERFGPADEEAIARALDVAARGLDGGRCVRLGAQPGGDTGLAEELAAHEAGSSTVVYVVSGGDGERARAAVAQADRVVVIQPTARGGVSSPAAALAFDGTPRRHTELVFVGTGAEADGRQTTRIAIPPGVRRVHVLNDPSSARLELLLAELRQTARGHDRLRDFAVFADLSDAELAWVEARLRWTCVDGGSVLVRQGASADDAWLLRAGRLEVVREAAGEEHHMAWLGPGAVVGEMALLTGGERTATVRAVRDSTVARLDRATVDTLLERSAGFARSVARVVASRSSGAPPSGRSWARTVAVLPLVEEGRARSFVATLAEALATEGLRGAIVDSARVDATLGAGASATRRGDVGDGDIIAWLDRLERRHDAVILVCGGTFDSWTRRAVRQSDQVVFVADGTETPELRPIERAVADLRATSTLPPDPGAADEPANKGPRHLVLLQPGGISAATGTGAWLDVRPGHVHHHVRAGSESDVARLARRLTGRAVALALSGASSRAPAHLGAVRAMAGLGLPIDVVSGSSSGAGIAALVAAGLPGDDALDRAIAVVTDGAPRLHQLQPPVTALTSGAATNRALQAAFGDRLLEDQPIPAVITAVDIRRHRQVRLTRGPLWKLVRASGSLPLLWPPVWHEGDLLVDGGIISYLPVEVFGDQADQGLVIASNLDESAGQGAPSFEGALDYGTTLNGWGEVARRIGGSRRARPPGLIDILFHSMAIPSFQQQEGLAALARRQNVCLLTPPLGSFGLFDVSAEIGRALEATAFEHASVALAGVADRWRRRRACAVG